MAIFRDLFAFARDSGVPFPQAICWRRGEGEPIKVEVYISRYYRSSCMDRHCVRLDEHVILVFGFLTLTLDAQVFWSIEGRGVTFPTYVQVDKHAAQLYP